VDLDSVANELYGLLPSKFTAARDAYVAEARGAGNRELAATIKILRKPSAGAWLANLLARQRSSEIEDLVSLGGQLRSAQDRLDGDKIRDLSNHRQQKVGILLSEARSLARQAGQSVSSSAMEDLAATLDAALADPEAAVALRTGRLTNGLHYSGLGLASDPTVVSPGPVEPKRGGTGQELRAAQIAAERAEQDLDRANEDVHRAEVAVASAEAELKQLKAAATLANRRAKDAQKAVQDAKRKIERERRQV
jgi:hypothetical protein